MRRISKEYEEPFVDVVKGFGEMRFSKAETARTLNISRKSMYNLLDRFDLHKHFYGRTEQLKCSTRGRKEKYTDDQLISEVVRYENYAEFKENSPIAPTTILRRLGGFKEARRLSSGLV